VFKNSRKNNKPDLFLEEAVLDDLAQELDALELPLSQKAFKLVGAAVFLVVAVVILRVLFLGGWQNKFYDRQALVNASQITSIRAERGIIFDRFDKPLVKNIPSFRLNLKLVDLFRNKDERIKTIEALQGILDLPPDYIENLIEGVNLEKQNLLTVVRELSVEQVIEIKNLNLPAVQIEDDFERQYPDGEILAHVLGYTGFVDKNDVKNNNSLSFNDVVGKNGLEAYYDEQLRGLDGGIINYRNAKGEFIEDKLLENAIPGNQLYLTIDSEFQAYFFRRLKQGLNSLGSQAGVGIALNPQNGEILALFSLPSFDNNQIADELLINAYKPFFNRAISGVYAPGSTIKPLVAFAALAEKLISPEKEIFSPGYLEIPNPYDPEQPSRFLDWRPNGWVNLQSAIARSCNVYFYEVGGGFEDVRGLGIEKLKEYWEKFGLGRKTGIDLPAENGGFLPDAQTKDKAGGVWRIGDTYNVSIGQGDLLTTPLQLVNYISAIANEGRIYQPFIVKKIATEQGSIIEEVKPKIVEDYSSDGEIIKEVQGGMIDAVKKSYGTAYLLSDLPFSAAAKTGTAQIESNTKINAFFVGYAPANPPAGGPQIAILVLVENAKEGSLNAVPVAKDVLEWYYYNRLTRY